MHFETTRDVGPWLRRIVRPLVATPLRRLVTLAVAIRLVLAYCVYGSDDVQGWQSWGWAIADGRSPYETQFLFAWPPLWLPFTAFAELVARGAGLPFHFVAKLFPIAADVAITLLLHRSATHYAAEPLSTARAYALHPLSVYTTSIHGNFDSIPLLCTLLALVASEQVSNRRSGWRAGLWIGLGGAFKTWPLLLAPALWAPTQPAGRRLASAAAAAAVFGGAIVIGYVVAGPKAYEAVLSYRGAPGWWGLTSLGLPLSGEGYSRIFYGSMTAVVVFTLAARVRPMRAALVLALTFYVATPGFGLQYLVWIVPLALLVDRRRAMAYTVIATTLVIVESLFRPYTGHVGEMFRALPHPGFARALVGPEDRFWTLSGRLVLWGWFIYWWGAALVERGSLDARREIAQADHPHTRAAVEGGRDPG